MCMNKISSAAQDGGVCGKGEHKVADSWPYLASTRLQLTTKGQQYLAPHIHKHQLITSSWKCGKEVEERNGMAIPKAGLFYSAINFMGNFYNASRFYKKFTCKAPEFSYLQKNCD